MDASAYFCPGIGSEFEGYPLPSSRVPYTAFSFTLSMLYSKYIPNAIGTLKSSVSLFIGE
jgi:hypothetical protein